MIRAKIHYPEVYLFIGDKTASAIEPIMEIHDRKWDNSASVVYFHVGTDRSGNREPKCSDSSGRLHRYHLQLPASDGSSKSARKELYQGFHRDQRHLAGLNKAIRKLSHHISDYGRAIHPLTGFICLSLHGSTTRSMCLYRKFHYWPHPSSSSHSSRCKWICMRSLMKGSRLIPMVMRALWALPSCGSWS